MEFYLYVLHSFIIESKEVLKILHFQVTIKNAAGLPPSLSHFVFCQVCSLLLHLKPNCTFKISYTIYFSTCSGAIPMWLLCRQSCRRLTKTTALMSTAMEAVPKTCLPSTQMEKWIMPAEVSRQMCLILTTFRYIKIMPIFKYAFDTTNFFSQEFNVVITEEFLEHCLEGALSIEVYGHRWDVLYMAVSRV